jgi:hypothetical protein
MSRFQPLAGLLVITAIALPASASELRVGAASVVITPAVGTPMAGYYSERAAEGVDDDLRAKAIVVEQDGSKVAMVVCDLISMTRPVADEARRLIQQSLGLPPQQVMISATHTHDGRSFLERVWAYKVLDVAARGGKPLDAEVQVFALGDELAFVALPGEIFVELGLAMKKQSPFRHTIIVELANGSVGYVPARRAYDEGNYEPISARCAAGSGERLAETAVRLLNEISGKLDIPQR